MSAPTLDDTVFDPLPRARVMMHQPSGGAGGSESDIVIRAGMLSKLKQRIAELTAQHSGQPVERIEADFDRDRWFSAQEAADYGLIDRVLASGTPALTT